MTHFWRKKKNAAARTTVLAAVIRTALVIVPISDDDEGLDGGDEGVEGFIGGGTGERSLAGKKVSMF